MLSPSSKSTKSLTVSQSDATMPHHEILSISPLELLGFALLLILILVLVCLAFFFVIKNWHKKQVAQCELSFQHLPLHNKGWYDMSDLIRNGVENALSMAHDEKEAFFEKIIANLNNDPQMQASSLRLKFKIFMDYMDNMNNSLKSCDEALIQAFQENPPRHGN